MASLLRLLVLLICSTSAMALMSGGAGNDPIERPGWPKGLAAVANLPTRVAHWEGPMGGQIQLLYRGSTEEFQEALDLFAKVEVPERVLVVQQGPADPSPGVPGEEDGSPIDWILFAIDVSGTGRIEGDDTLFRRAFSAPPTLRVYVAGEGVDGIEFAKLRIPQGLKVDDRRATAHGYALADAPVFRGRVEQIAASSTPIRKALVTLNPKPDTGAAPITMYTDATGQFEFRRVPVGTHEFTVTAPGYAAREGYFRIGPNGFEEQTVRLAPQTQLSGAVVDPAGAPVSGVTIRAGDFTGPDGEPYPGSHETVTDAGGRFTINGLPKGRLRLFAHSKTHLIADSLKQYEVPGEPITLHVVQTGRLAGKVQTPSGDQPSIHVTPEGGNKIGSWGGSAYLKPDGSFAFDTIPPGRYVVSTNPTGEPGTLVEIKPGEETKVTLDK